MLVTLAANALHEGALILPNGGRWERVPAKKKKAAAKKPAAKKTAKKKAGGKKKK